MPVAFGNAGQNDGGGRKLGRLPPIALTVFRSAVEDRSSLRIEGKSHPPFTVCRAEAKLFHVRVTRAFQRADARPSGLRPEPPEKMRERQNLCLHVLVQAVELQFEFIADLNDPIYLSVCRLIHTYDVKCMYVGV